MAKKKKKADCMNCKNKTTPHERECMAITSSHANTSHAPPLYNVYTCIDVDASETKKSKTLV